jgi:parallel beta-helix repeat protein
MKRFIWLPAVIGALLLSTAPVQSDEGFYVIAGRPAVGTRITSLPYTINAPGYYYLNGNLSYTGGNGITVQSSNVTIDLMGFTLAGPNISSTYRGVYIHNQNNVEVRNGTLTGWYMGVQEDSGGNHHRIIGIRAFGNRYGINLIGTDHLIEGCTAFPGTFGATQGLVIFGNGSIRGCTVMNFGYGIYISGGTVSGNVVSGCTTRGIYALSSTVINDNQVSNCAVGIDGSGGGSIIGNIVSAGSGQTGIVPSTGTTFPNLVDQNAVGGNGTRYGPGSAATVWGVNGG